MSESAVTPEYLNTILDEWASAPPAIPWWRPLDWRPWDKRPSWLTADLRGTGISIGAYEIGRAVLQRRADLDYLVTEDRGVPITIHIGPDRSAAP